MTKLFKPTQAQCDLMYQAAGREAHIAAKSILLEPGLRINTTDRSKQRHMNIALVTNEPLEWNDTDLHDYGDWKDFRSGQRLTETGGGIFDFHIRRRGDYENFDLLGHVTVYIEGREIARIQGYENRAPLYVAPLRALPIGSASEGRTLP